MLTYNVISSHSYIFNRGWMEKDVLPPSYKEIVGEDESDHSDGDAADSKTDGKADGNADKAASTGATASLDEDLSDIEAIEEAEQFERRYNFRFEELEATGAADPSTIAITTHSRTIPDSARRKDTRRAEQRQRRKEKKDSEKGRKDEELKRLKNLKKMEILERLKTIQKISGIKDDEKIAGLVEGVDLDEDFDPERWDAKMGSVFEEQYYGEDSAAVDALEKPKFDDDDEDDRLIAKLTGASATGKQGKKAKRNKAKKINLDAYAYEEVDEDDDFCMDADYMDGGEAALHHDDADVGVPVVNEDTSATTTTKKKGKKGKEDMKKTSFSDYLDEYFQLDYQDMVYSRGVAIFS